MKVILLLSIKSLLHNWRSTIIKILSYALCMSFILIQSIIMFSLYSTEKEAQLIRNGSQNGIILNGNFCWDDFNCISSIGIVKIVGETLSNNIYNKTLMVGYVDDKFKEINHITLKKGRFPVESNEILIEESAALLLDVSLYENVKLKIQSNEGSNIEQKFSVVGISEDFSETQWKSKKSTSLLPSIFVSSKFLKQNNLDDLPTLYSILLNDGIHENDFFNDKLIENNNCDDYFINIKNSNDILLSNSVFIKCIGTIISTGILTVFFFLCMLLLTNRQRNKQIGLYRIIGFEKLEIYIIFLFQLFLELVCGMLFGTFIGIKLAPLLMKYLKLEIAYHISMICILISLISVIAFSTLLLLVSLHKAFLNNIICNIQYYSDIKKIVV